MLGWDYSSPRLRLPVWFRLGSVFLLVMKCFYSAGVGAVTLNITKHSGHLKISLNFCFSRATEPKVSSDEFNPLNVSSTIRDTTNSKLSSYSKIAPFLQVILFVLVLEVSFKTVV